MNKVEKEDEILKITHWWCFVAKVAVQPICESLEKRVPTNNDHPTIQTLKHSGEGQ